MPGLFSHTTRSTGTILTAEIYNGDFQNIVDNMEPDTIDDFSFSTAQMQSAVDPGESGAESLATTLAGELERLRFAVKETKNYLGIEPVSPQWYSTPTALIPVAKVDGAVTAGDVTTSGLTMATARLLGRLTAATGAIEEISVGANLTFTGGTLDAPSASTTVRGTVELATQAEADAGTADLVATTDLNKLALGTALTTLNGTTRDFNVPAGTRRITINLADFSTNGTSIPLIQLGDAGGFEVTGYAAATTRAADSSVISAQHTTGFGLGPSHSATTLLNGSIILTLLDAASFKWSCSFVLARGDISGTHLGGGSKTLSAELTQVRLTTTNGTDTFDLGVVNITYER